MYVNKYGEVKLFTVFILFQSSSCLSDREEDDLYDFAAKYQGQGDRGKLNKLSPSRYEIPPSP